ncbi:DUF4129 domain-containing protein [Niastella vici]|nr:DUF4129 domain-containing protein [Niastella vici]
MNYFASYRSLYPTAKTFRLVLCLVALLSCSPLIHAQVDDPVVDTTVTVEDAPVADSKEEDYGEKIRTVLNNPPELRKVPDSTVNSLQKQKDFAYANDPEYWAHEQERQAETRSSSNNKSFWDYFNGFFAGKTIRTITYGILIAFFLFVIYRIIVVNKLFLFYSGKKAKATESDEAIDIADDNLDEKIQKAVAAKEHRLAVRFMYLKALQRLNDKQWIRYHADGTNHEYVSQMSGHKLATEFGFLTRVYDYMWYGEFSVTEEQFEIVQKNFNHFYNAVNP